MSSVLPALLRAFGPLGARLLLCSALALGALASAPIADAHAAGSHHHRHIRHQHLGRSAPGVHHAMRIAVRKKGSPYRYGAEGPRRFDCSGLTFFSFRRAGFRHIPRTSSQQAHFARRIKRRRLRRGDLIFFYNRGGVYHVGLFAGWRHHHRRILHAPHPGARVHTERLWTHRWFAGTLRYR